MNVLAAIANHTPDPLSRYAQGLPGFGGMSPPQEEFHSSDSRKRASISANGIGKTYKGAAEAWWHMLGNHPFRETPALRVGWVLCPDLKSGWANISRVMRELEPPGALDPACKYVDGVGYLYRSRKIIKTIGDGMMVGQGCKQEVMALEGDRIGWLWVDEPPTPRHWGAARARVDRTGGPMWLTATPINRPVDWLRALLEGDPENDDPTYHQPEPGWWVKHYPLSPDNAPHLTAEQIENMIDGYAVWERPQRIRAEWEGYTTGRRFPAFTDSLIIDDEEVERLTERHQGRYTLRIGIDHGEGDTNQIAYLILVVGSHRDARYYVIGEACPPGAGSTPDDVAAAIVDMLGEWGFGVAHIKERCAFGDANSSGLLGGGIRYNRFIERAMCDLLQISDLPFRIDIPSKSGGSVDVGETAMHMLMKSGRWYVHRSCRMLIRSYRHYTHKRESDLKNAIDAARYAVGDHLLRWGRRPAPYIRRV